MLTTLVKGLSWIGMLRLSTRIVGIVKIFILARLLTPFHFGLFGVASLVLSVLDVISESGISVFLIQKEDKLKEYINVAWLISITRGIFLFISILFIAPYVSVFLNTNEAENLIKLISLVPLIKGFVNPAVVKYLQELDFRKEFFFRFIIFTVDAVSAVLFGYVYYSEVCLVLGLIIGALVEVFLSFIIIKEHPSFVVDFKKIRHILSRGKWVTLYGVSEYVNRNIDDIFISKFFGPTALGIYQMAYKIGILPVTEIADTIGKVTFPIYVKLAGKSKESLENMLYWNTLVLVSILIPFSLIVFLYSNSLVTLFLGSQWLESAEIIKIVVIYALIRSSINPVLTYFLAIKKQEYLAIVSGLSTIALLSVISTLSGIYGVKGVAMSTVLSSLLSIPVLIYLYKITKKYDGF